MTRRRRQKISTELYTTQINTLSHEGRGVACIDGKTTFIRNALPNETVAFKYTSKHGSFDTGEAFEIILASPDRVKPCCPHFSICGGCCMQHLDHTAQLKHKEQTLIDHLEHFGNIKPKSIIAPLTGNVFGYRNKARLSVRHVTKKDKVLVGFRETNGRFVADINECPVLHSSIGTKISALKTFMATLQSFQAIPQIEIAIGDKQTAIIIRHLKPLPLSDIDKIIEFAAANQLTVYLQPTNAASVHKIYPKDTPEYLSYTIPDHNIELHFHPCDFTQVNPSINIPMINSVMKLLELNINDKVLDLFCGLGNFTLPLAKYCNHVTGVEGSQEMVERGKMNSQHNNINNVDFYAANLNESITQYEWSKQKYDKILLDPPRSGAVEILGYLAKLKAKKIVYVSCNPATLARDAGILVNEHGYTLKTAGIMDMFPHTAHVESIALFEK